MLQSLQSQVSDVSEKSHGLCTEFQALKIDCQLDFIAKSKPQNSSGFRETSRDEAVKEAVPESHDKA